MIKRSGVKIDLSVGIAGCGYHHSILTVDNVVNDILPEPRIIPCPAPAQVDDIAIFVCCIEHSEVFIFQLIGRVFQHFYRHKTRMKPYTGQACAIIGFGRTHPRYDVAVVIDIRIGVVVIITKIPAQVVIYIPISVIVYSIYRVIGIKGNIGK